jgi:hypothetical protein
MPTLTSDFSATPQEPRSESWQNPEFTPQQFLDWDCSQDALYWAQKWTLTENPHYLEQKLPYRAPFPKKSYFVPLFKALVTESRLFIPKTREMITSWAIMAHGAHRAQWYKAEVIVQTESEDKAQELVGYAECLYRNQPDWLRAMHPLKGEASRLHIEWADGGRVFGIPHGENKIRLYHPTIVIFDEAAFLTDFERAYNAAQPVAQQIIAVSSAGPGRFADLCSH